MLTIFGKKKIKEDVVTNIFVNTIFNTIDKGFSEIVGLLNDAPEFEISPKIAINNVDHFTLIVFAGNIQNIATYFNNEQGDRITELILNKLCKIYEVDYDKLCDVLKHYQCYLSKINHPSKNMLYAMSKAIFGKYDLYKFQDEYFKNMKSPNPMLLKRLDEVMETFLWNWNSFTKKHQIRH